MKLLYSISLIILVLLPSLSLSMQTQATKLSLEQQTSPYQYTYYTNNSLTNFDIQNINSIIPGYIYVSFVENNLIYYNNLSTTRDVIGNAQLNHNDFFVFNINSIYLNSSTTITGSQYISIEIKNLNVFAVYFTFKGNYYCYVFLVRPNSNTILNVKLFSGLQYYKSNSLFTNLESIESYFEFRTNDSFIIYRINNTDFTFSKQFESKKIDLSSYTFDVRDVQFYNLSMYLIFNINSLNNYFNRNSTVFHFYLENNTLSYNTYYFNTFISSIAIYQNNLFAYVQDANIVPVVDLETNQTINLLNNAIMTNFTLIRSFNNNTFLLQDFQDNFYYCFLIGHTLFTNQTIFDLYNTHPQDLNTTDPQITNNEYFIALFGSDTYFLAGYYFNPLNTSERTGFGMVLQPIINQPTIFIDSNKNPSFTQSTNRLTQSTNSLTQFTSSTVSTSGLDSFPFILLIILTIGGVSAFVYFRIKNKTLGKPVKGIQEINPTSLSKETPKIQFCSFCGSKVYEFDVFCQNCGNKL